jgi:HD-GYP domain-containing protein (c-di-GMP phosphodiesterase class II)
MSPLKYLAIPPGAIMPGSMPKFKIYVLSSHGQYVLWTLEGNRVSAGQLDKLSESGQREVFIDLDEQFKYEEYLEAHLENILGNQGPSDDQKAAIFSRVSTNVVKHAFESSFGFNKPIGTDVLQRTQAMIEKALIFIAESKSLQALAKIVGHDYKTYEHATKVLWFTVGFLSNNADVLQRVRPDSDELEESQRMEVLRQCGVAALLHDIGKTLVAQNILHKNGPLTELEWEIMKRHPFNGLAMLLDTDLPGFVKKGVLHHHEDFCGGGYPMGIEGPDIPTLPRVLRIVDTFDAMTSRRPYKEPIPPFRAAQIMVGESEDKKGGADAGQDIRDQGMRRCFDEELLRKFIVFLGNMKLVGF